MAQRERDTEHLQLRAIKLTIKVYLPQHFNCKTVLQTKTRTKHRAPTKIGAMINQQQQNHCLGRNWAVSKKLAKSPLENMLLSKPNICLAPVEDSGLIQCIIKGKQSYNIIWYLSLTPVINTHAGVSNGARSLQFGLSLHLHPFFVYASSEDSGESAHMRRLAWIFVARHGNKYQNITDSHWPG